jgi:hypothetical protein
VTRTGDNSRFQMFTLLMALFAFFASAPGAAALKQKTAIRGTSVVQIRFVRSGGFGGNMPPVEGVVDLKSDTPSVTSAGNTSAGNYARTLAPGEVERLRCAVDTSAKCAESGAAPVPDGYTYQVFVTQKDGKAIGPLKFQPESKGQQGISPELTSWIQEEIRRIWDFRLKQRKVETSGPAPQAR